MKYCWDVPYRPNKEAEALHLMMEEIQKKLSVRYWKLRNAGFEPELIIEDNKAYFKIEPPKMDS